METGYLVHTHRTQSIPWTTKALLEIVAHEVGVLVPEKCRLKENQKTHNDGRLLCFQFAGDMDSFLQQVLWNL